jgi:hypothetical protein
VKALRGKELDVQEHVVDDRLRKKKSLARQKNCVDKAIGVISLY